jgi:hypothetical protein
MRKLTEKRKVPARHGLPGLFVEIAGSDGERVRNLAGSLRNTVQRAGAIAGFASLLATALAGAAIDFAGQAATKNRAAATACRAGDLSILACTAILPNGFVSDGVLIGCRVENPVLDLFVVTAMSSTGGACPPPLALALGAFSAARALTLRTGDLASAVAGRACRLAVPSTRGALPCVTDTRDATDAIAWSERLVGGSGGLRLSGAPALNPLHSV